LTDEEVTAVQSALQYFSAGGLRHTADEEESLFPQLRVSSATDPIADLGRLESDHRQANELHAMVDTSYSEWIAAGHLSPEDELRLRSGTEQLKHLYQEHIQVEEKIVFPRAIEMLNPQAIAAMGQEFHARRR
jgi:iron-sulfur cluster repair protein YtfE (RIC family)